MAKQATAKTATKQPPEQTSAAKQALTAPAQGARQQEMPPDTKKMPTTFDPAYVEGAVKPFFLSGTFLGERPVLPMIDLTFSKNMAMSAHLIGMLYDDWKPNAEEDGISVFLQPYEQRGPHNERKRIYYSAVTPDLYAPMYAPKVARFLDTLFAPANDGTPLMHQYYQHFFDLYWDLHLGLTGDAIPLEVRQIGQSFLAVLGYWYPTMQVVHDNYMQVRKLRPFLKEWVDHRVQEMLDGKVPHPETTIVHYWIKNGGLGEHFRRKDMIFECFHNFLAFSQWGNTLYNIMDRLEPTRGDSQIRAWFTKTMRDDPDATDGTPFTRLDRFVMELFRIISPNAGSVSALSAREQSLGAGYTGYNTIVMPHPETSRDPTHWTNPDDFDPERYIHAPTSAQNDAARSKQVGLAQCPFSHTSFPVKDGRQASITNSAFGATYAQVDGHAYPVCDDAGYAPFGFGYRRCPGEFLNMRLFGDLLRKVWREQITFRRLTLDHAEELPVGPRTVVADNLAFTRTDSPTHR